MLCDKLCSSQKDFFRILDITGTEGAADKETADTLTHLTDNLSRLNEIIKDYDFF